ncbi:hypothetical protein JI664_11625 [Rhodobacter sp. NTK016B]|uniref:hypothetical protein n=1 Tax=Rhodobacter sp. NTK016B TaxID=2759676 RepID=UPI001A8EEA6F|nr:hypothetical protein [Rhodobacter sp. NTK016B]MBN8292613.1 hypothetical protein [Rhodobacter sp. NTK016B]
MDASEIRDGESLRAWLESLPDRIGEEEAQRWAVLIAHRAAMRVLPIYWRWQQVAKHNNRDANANEVLRVNLIGGVGGTYPTPPIRQAVAHAAHAAGPAAHATNPAGNAAADASRAAIFAADASLASRAAFAAAYASHAAAGTAVAVFAACATDASALEAGTDLNAVRLWPEENPFESQWSEIRDTLSDQGPGWHFWLDWYDKALKGEAQDWDLLTKIALIDDADWDKPEAEVNALIAGIVHEHRSQATKPPDPPQITDVERSHIQLVLATPTASRRSAEFLRVQFETMEAAYLRQVGCPNETPPELEPIVTLAKTFGKIAQLLAETSDKELLIVRLEEQIRVLKQQNATLIASANGPKASLMREVFAGCLGSATGALLATMITTNFSFFGGPAVAEGAEALSNIIEPLEPGPVIPIWPSIPRD